MNKELSNSSELGHTQIDPQKKAPIQYGGEKRRKD
jgi:hypothetical protein